MLWIESNIKLIMLICGAATCTTFYAAVAPQAALDTMFGASLEGPLAEILVRNWGLLISGVGVLLIYGAFKPTCRTLALVNAALTKTLFIGLVLAYGRQYFPHAILAVAGDLIMVTLSLLCLRAIRRGH